MGENIIEIRGLTIEFRMRNGVIKAVNDVDFNIEKGKITALVGESGSGKSTLAYALLGLVNHPGIISAGKIFFKGEDILQFNKEKLRKYRWESVAMIFQAAQNSLNPVMTIQEQMLETLKEHKGYIDTKESLKKIKELLEYVRLNPDRVLKSFPHELSGGMKQRVIIAFSLLLDPEVIILDEPTTALDVITQAYIFEILKSINKEKGITMLLLTHDIGIVAKVADQVGVMYAGRIVESANVFDIFERPKHPYTQSLIKAAPSLVGDLKDVKSIMGTPPNLMDLPKGCAFHPRCFKAFDKCRQERPARTNFEINEFVECHLYSENLSQNLVN
ncbi:oligopeptide/dipeptide ABC transporter, ATPase subunit [Caldicellulosiruptor hydrothermalis 108]|uniref:Oligopeptide/dipeptide ABC transporter, ATPase subunit n=1 Tax=Caldicellulosiruptor hydrothermalis (strain DSM 18901 / VKM B-2411 / 108) TaxID=632292 RepID=E4Q924_CALH1|nr:ABC transporter ATP-binding protein [Caldicellulosiruptor hydrothermalis]ADQ08073.1 oligopeptide/dipeptide ABC transporter, ATPase subunit [Caldicellulosiruptor hydrothermalis 108]